jgi:hypothetical protein
MITWQHYHVVALSWIYVVVLSWINVMVSWINVVLLSWINFIVLSWLNFVVLSWINVVVLSWIIVFVLSWINVIVLSLNHSIPHNATLYTVMLYIRLQDTSAEATIREDLLRIGTVNRANPQRRSSRVKKMLDLTALCQSFTTMTKKEFAYRLIGLLRCQWHRIHRAYGVIDTTCIWFSLFEVVHKFWWMFWWKKPRAENLVALSL